MAEFVLNQPVKTTTASVEVTVDPDKPLPIGRHRFQLVVTDESGNTSQPDVVEVIVRDTKNPTAVIDAEPQSEYGSSFVLDGRRSSDVPPGRIVSYEWTLIPALDRPVIPVRPGRPIVTPIDRPIGPG